MKKIIGTISLLLFCSACSTSYPIEPYHIPHNDIFKEIQVSCEGYKCFSAKDFNKETEVNEDNSLYNLNFNIQPESGLIEKYPFFLLPTIVLGIPLALANFFTGFPLPVLSETEMSATLKQDDKIVSQYFAHQSKFEWETRWWFGYTDVLSNLDETVRNNAIDDIIKQVSSDDNVKKIVTNKRLEEKIKQEQKAKQKKELSKKYGYKWCDEKYFFLYQDKCMIDYTPFLRVLQQTSDGTLYQWGNTVVVFMIYNKNDSSLPDGDYIRKGMFAIDGTYKYTNIYGATKTVKKIKRLK